MPARAALLLLSPPGDPEPLIEALGGIDGYRVMRREVASAQPRPGTPQAPSDLFTVACEWRGDDIEVAVRALRQRAISALIDPERSAALAGVDHELLPWDGNDGAGAAVLIYAMRRLPTLDRAAFHQYWLETHSVFGRAALAGRGYRQVHGDAAESSAVANAAGVAIDDFDGAVVSACESWQRYFDDREVPARIAAGAAALSDEDNFIDHTRSMSMRFTVV